MESKISSVFEVVKVVVASVSDSDWSKVVESENWVLVVGETGNLVSRLGGTVGTVSNPGL